MRLWPRVLCEAALSISSRPDRLLSRACRPSRIYSIPPSTRLLLISVGIPTFGMCLCESTLLASSCPADESTLDWIVRGHRANVTVYNVPPAYPRFFMSPCMLSITAIIYGMLSLRAFLRRWNIYARRVPQLQRIRPQRRPLLPPHVLLCC